MHFGVKLYIIDLKKRSQYEVTWISDTTKVRLLPGFDYQKRPLALNVRHDTIYLRNLQTMQVVNKFRDKI